MSKLKSKEEQLKSINKLGNISAQGLSAVSSLNNERKTTTIEEEKTLEKNIEKTNVPTATQENRLNNDINRMASRQETNRYQNFVQQSGKDSRILSISLLDDAPAEYNFFSKLDETDFLYLKMSIMNNGLFNPIIVWEKINGRYMILSGHNRVNAFRELLAEYTDDKYMEIPAIIYGVNEIDEKKAKEIIIDTNFIQRGNFGPKLRARILKERMDIYKNQKDKKGRRIDELAKDLGIQRTAIYEDIQIIEKLIPEIQEMFFTSKITRKAALRACMISKELQNTILEEPYCQYVDTVHLMQIKSEYTEEKILSIFSKQEEKKKINKEIKISIPESHYDEFMIMYKKFIENISENDNNVVD